MPSILFSLALTIPLAVGLVSPLNGQGLLIQSNGLQGGDRSPNHPPHQFKSVRGGVVSEGTAPAIAQIFPDISNPEVQRLLQADGLITLGYIEDGIALIIRESQRLHEQGDYQGEAEILNALAASLQSQGQLQRAAIYYQQALALYAGNADDLGSFENYSYEIGELVKRLGAVYLSLDETEQALAAYEQGLAIVRRVTSPWEQANILSHMGIAYRLAEQPDQALTAYQQALAYYQDMGGNPYDAPQVWNRVGLIYLAQGQFESALAAFQQGLDAIADPQDSFQVMGRILTLENMSRLYEMQGQSEQAAAYAQQAETALTTLPEGRVAPAGDALRQAMLLENIGEFYLAERDFERANQYFERALAIAHQSFNAPYDEMSLLNGIILNYTRAGQPEQTIPYEERIVTVLREGEPVLNNATSLARLAQAYQRAGQWEQALATYQQALATYEEARQQFESQTTDVALIFQQYGTQTTDVARIFQQVGQIYEAQEQSELALAAYQQALMQYQEAEFPYGQIFVLDRLANLYGEQGQGEQAEQYAQQAQTLRNEMLANTMP